MVTKLTAELRELYAPGVPFTTSQPYKNLVDMFDASASAYPERVALDFLGRKTTYAELQRQTRSAATVLRQRGVKPGDFVHIILPNSPQQVAAMFGAMRLGATVALHNPLAPAALLNTQLRGNVIVAWEKIVADLPSDKCVMAVSLVKAMPLSKQLLLKAPVDKARTMSEALRGTKRLHGLSFDNEMRSAPPYRGKTVHTDGAALALFTGGTTGKPKAVGLSHHNLTTNVETAIAWAEQLRYGCETVYAALPFFHAFGLTCALLSAIRLAATIVVFPTFDPAMIVGAQKRLPATFFPAVPPMLTRVAEKAKSEGVKFSSLIYTICGAMPLSVSVAQMWEEFTGALIIEGYGMTETSPLLLGSPTTDARRPGALGIPMCNNDIRIVDPDNPTVDVKDGEIGELITKGPNVCMGYLGDEEETKALFTSEGWLRTGDLVQVRDGFVYIADRRKELIITGGFNVYPSEVEAVVRSMPGISDVAVVGIPDEHSGESVVAAIIAEPGVDVNLQQVREWAERNLAHYALPRQLVVLSELPRSQIGKVMRRAVREQLLESATSIRDQAGAFAEAAGQRISSRVEDARANLQARIGMTTGESTNRAATSCCQGENCQSEKDTKASGKSNNSAKS